MARESCNLDKDEAEILAPSSSPSAPPSSPPSLFSMPPAPTRPDRPEEQTPAAAPAPAPAVATPAKSGGKADPPSRFGNRCSSCRKRVGLLGFRCRCGDLFCGRHRYSSTHDCSFDYKTVGREEISKNNPVIRAAKIIRI